MSLPYDELTLALVAERAGVTVPTVLRHVGSKDGLLVEGARHWVPDEEERRDATPGDIPAIARVLAARYEVTGTIMLRYVAVAERVPTIAELIEQARQAHREWLEEVFADHLPTAPLALRRRRVAQLFAATEVYSWMSWRTSLGMSARQAELALAEALDALVTSWRQTPRRRTR